MFCTENVTYLLKLNFIFGFGCRFTLPHIIDMPAAQQYDVSINDNDNVFL